MAYVITWFVDAIGVSSTCIYNDEVDLPSVVTISDQIVGGWKETLPSVVTITEIFIPILPVSDSIGISSTIDAIGVGVTLNTVTTITDEIITKYLDEVLEAIITIVDEVVFKGCIDAEEKWTKQSPSQTSWTKQ